MERTSTAIFHTLTYKFNTILNMISVGFSAGQPDMLTIFKESNYENDQESLREE